MALDSDKISNHDLIKDNEEENLPNEVLNSVCIKKAYINVESLTVLKLEDLLLEELPQDLPDLCHLIELSLSGNQLCTLPVTLLSAKKLRVLNLAKNCFEIVPKCLISGLYTLEKIDISDNYLQNFNVPPSCLPLLKEFVIAHNLLTEIPEWLLYDDRFLLNVLDLSFNPCFHLKTCFKVPYNNRVSGIVRTLKLINTYFTNVSLGFFMYFPSLLSLDLSGNKINCSRISNFSVELIPSGLEELILENVGLAMLPDLKTLKKLKILNVSSNPLDWLPAQEPFSCSLRSIDLSHTNLMILPNYISDLSFLTCLMLSDNALESLPSSFNLLINLEVLDLYNNLLLSLPRLESFQKLHALDLWMNYFEPPSHPLVEGCLRFEELKTTLRGTYNFQNREDKVKVDNVSNDGDITRESSLFSTSPECDSHMGISHVSEPESCQKVEDELWDAENDDDQYDPTANHLNDIYKTILNNDFERDCLKFCSEDIRNSPHLFQPFEERSNSNCWIQLKEKERLVHCQRHSSVVDGQFDDD